MADSNDYVIETFTGKGDQPHRWRIRHTNGHIIQSGEGYINSSDRDDVAEHFSEATGIIVKNADADS